MGFFLVRACEIHGCNVYVGIVHRHVRLCGKNVSIHVGHFYIFVNN